MSQLINGPINGGLVHPERLSPLTGLLSLLAPFCLGHFPESLFQDLALLRGKLADSFEDLFDSNCTHVIRSTTVISTVIEQSIHRSSPWEASQPRVRHPQAYTF
jgi:hypothetical protein